MQFSHDTDWLVFVDSHGGSVKRLGSMVTKIMMSLQINWASIVRAMTTHFLAAGSSAC